MARILLSVAIAVLFNMPYALHGQVTGIPDSIVEFFDRDRDVRVWIDQADVDGDIIQLRRAGGAFETRGYVPRIGRLSEVALVCRKYRCGVYVPGWRIRGDMVLAPHTRPTLGRMDILLKVRADGGVLELMFGGLFEVSWDSFTSVLWTMDDMVVLDTGELLHLGRVERVDAQPILR